MQGIVMNSQKQANLLFLEVQALGHSILGVQEYN